MAHIKIITAHNTALRWEQLESARDRSRGNGGASSVSIAKPVGDLVVFHDHQRLDIANADDRLTKRYDKDKPDVVINCAAWTDVDGCESWTRNGLSRLTRADRKTLLNASRANGAPFVTISTDYVFDGTKEGFYTEADQPNPQSVYGLSKLEGERRARRASARDNRHTQRIYLRSRRNQFFEYYC